MRWLNTEPPHQGLRCLQIQLFSSLVVKELKTTVTCSLVFPANSETATIARPINVGRLSILVSALYSIQLSSVLTKHQIIEQDIFCLFSMVSIRVVYFPKWAEMGLISGSEQTCAGRE